MPAGDVLASLFCEICRRCLGPVGLWRIAVLPRTDVTGSRGDIGQDVSGLIERMPRRPAWLSPVHGQNRIVQYFQWIEGEVTMAKDRGFVWKGRFQASPSGPHALRLARYTVDSPCSSQPCNEVHRLLRPGAGGLWEVRGIDHRPALPGCTRPARCWHGRLAGGSAFKGAASDFLV